MPTRNPSIPIALLALAIGLSGLGSRAAQAYEEQIQAQARKLARDIAKTNIGTVAVVDFSDPSGTVTELGRFLAEELSGELATARKGFEVIDRSKLKSLLREHKLATTGLLDPQTTREMGKIAGVNALVTGTLTRMATTVHLRLNVLDVETAKLGISSAVDIPETDQIKALLRREVEEPMDEPVLDVQASAAQAKESNGVRFTLPSCQRARRKVRCAFLATSLHQEKELALTLESRAIDRSGNEYPADLVQIGQREGETAKNRLLVGTPLRVSIHFSGVPTNLRAFQVMELDFQSFRVRFEDVAIAD